MTFEDFNFVQQSLLDQCLKMSETKGVEYANSAVDRLANFKEIAAELGLRPEQVCYIYLQKHMRSIAQFCKTGETKSNESIESRIVDAITYLTLLHGINCDRLAQSDKTISLNKAIANELARINK